MSDGMSDGAVMGNLATAVQKAAYDLAKAIQDAKAGYRGLGIDAISLANETLEAWDLRIQERVTKEQWR